MRTKTEPKIQLQDYQLLLENPYRLLDFTVDHLNQRDILEALGSIDLLHPGRSTLNERSSPQDSSLTIDKVNKDLEALEWQECSVQSLETLGPSKPRVNGAGSDVFPAFKIGLKKPRTKDEADQRSEPWMGV